jgi:hypothetical protein
MWHTRVGLLLLVLVVLAGCNAGPGDRTPEPIEVSASEATVSSEAVSAAGFAEAGVEEVQVDRSGTLSVSGDVEMDLGYQIRATGWRATYRSAEGASVFGLYTAPMAQPERVDARIDPLGDRSLAEIVAGAQTTYEDPADLERVQNRTVAVLGSETTVQQFAGTATRDGEDIEVTVHVATVDHEGDRLRAVGVTPREADNWETLRSLFEGVSH